MPNPGLNESQQIARDIVVAALTPGGNHASSLPQLIGLDGNRLGDFLGDAYASVLRKVEDAHREQHNR
jgi:hypothetical protein